MWKCAFAFVVVVLFAGLLSGCGGEEGPPEFVDGTCVQMSSTGAYGTNCAYASDFEKRSYEGDTWCKPDPGRPEDGLGRTELHPLRADGSYVDCASLGYPVRCSNCTGRDFFYEEGKTCSSCTEPGPTCTDLGGTCTSSSQCCEYDCPSGTQPMCGSASSSCICGQSAQDRCSSCLASCRGLPSCCTGTGCICDSDC